MYGSIETQDENGRIVEGSDDLESSQFVEKFDESETFGVRVKRAAGKTWKGLKLASKQTSVAAALAVGGILGTGLRVALKKTESHAGVAETYMLAQVFGCWILGFWQRNEYSRYLNVAICSGFAGALTTFSSWALLSAQVIVDNDKSPVEKILLWSQYQFTCLGAGLFAYHFGFRQGFELEGQGDTALGGFVSLIFLASLAVYGVFAISDVAALQMYGLSILGTWIRFILSQALNAEDSFPSGTLFANALGCIMIGYSATWADPQFSAQLADGFCGSLSTFSTFVAELYHLRKSESIAYGVLSVVLNQVLISTMLSVFALQNK